MNKINEYNGLDIINEVKYDTHKLVSAIGNHNYSDYEGLKLLVDTIIKLDEDKIPLIVDSLTNLELTMLERTNPHASIGYNKKVHDFCSIICALNDCGYKFDSDNFSSKMFQLRGNLIIKNANKLDIMIHNPINFSYIENGTDALFNKELKSNEMINGLELCNLMLYIGSNNYNNSYDVIKHGNFIKTNDLVKVLK